MNLISQSFQPKPDWRISVWELPSENQVKQRGLLLANLIINNTFFINEIFNTLHKL